MIHPLVKVAGVLAVLVAAGLILGALTSEPEIEPVEERLSQPEESLGDRGGDVVGLMQGVADQLTSNQAEASLIIDQCSHGEYATTGKYQCEARINGEPIAVDVMTNESVVGDGGPLEVKTWDYQPDADADMLR